MRHVDKRAIGIRRIGQDVHSRFQATAASGKAPGTDRLLSSTRPVRDTADTFAGHLESLADALDTFAAEAKPHADRLNGTGASCGAGTDALTRSVATPKTLRGAARCRRGRSGSSNGRCGDRCPGARRSCG